MLRALHAPEYADPSRDLTGFISKAQHVMEVFLFTLVAVLLYFVADWMLRWIEAAAGRVLPQRSLVFFAILLIGGIVTFWVIRNAFSA